MAEEAGSLSSVPVRERERYSPEQIRALLRKEEGQLLEFKSLWDRSGARPSPLDRRQARDLIAESIAGFANADGGTLLLGVNDDGTPTGHGYPADAVETFLRVVDRLRPTPTVDFQRVAIDGHELLVFEVEMAPEAVMVEGNGFPFRVGDRFLREPQEVINARKETYRRVGFEQRVRHEATLADLDLDLARATLRDAARGAGEPIERQLESLGLVLPKGGGIAITNAALLLFGRPPLARWHPRMGLRLFRVRGTERAHGERRNVVQLGRLELPIASLISEAHRFTSAQIGRSERLHDLFFREVPEYPTFAWQEALVNAVAHRDYGDQGREIEVWFFEDRLAIESPGELVPPVTIERLRAREQIHSSRNPLLVRVLVEAGIMREEGEGLPRMFDEMSASFLHDPILEAEAATFRVVLRNEPVFVGPSPEWQRVVEGLNLAVSQRRVLLAHPTGFTNEDYRRLNGPGLDRDQAYREIQDLLARGVIQGPGRPGRGASYTISPSLLGPPSWERERAERLRAHFAAQPGITNSQYRAAFSVPRHTAKRELRRLVERGFLTQEGTGRATRYGPGPALTPPG